MNRSTTLKSFNSFKYLYVDFKGRVGNEKDEFSVFPLYIVDKLTTMISVATNNNIAITRGEAIIFVWVKFE